MSIVDLTVSSQESSEKIYGVVIGIVTNNQDPEEMARVKVRFPWRENNDESDWARVAVLMAGNDRGTFFLPEVDDEVMVAFDQGDINHPYVIGMLWNGHDKPPETNKDGKNNIRKIRSRSGHEIIFNDDSEKKCEKLEIRAKSGHSIVLDDTDGEEKIEIKDKDGLDSILIDSAQNSITIASSAKIIINAQMIEIKADASMTLESSGVIKIKGSMVMIN